MVGLDVGSKLPALESSRRELFYARGDEVLTVPVKAGPDLGIGSPQVVFTAGQSLGPSLLGFAVANDGNRLLTVEQVVPTRPRRSSISWSAGSRS